MQDPTKRRQADLISGVLVAVLGLAVLIAGAQMPMGGTYGGVANPWYASPAALPLLLGTLLMLMGGQVFVTGWKAAGMKGFRATWDGSIGQPSGRVRLYWIAGIWAMLVLYTLALAWKPFGGLAPLFARWIAPSASMGFLTDPSGVNYWLASGLFLSMAVLISGRLHASSARVRPWRVGGLIGFLWIAALLLSFLFAGPLQVPLP